MYSKLFVDDIREVPDDTWDVARSFHEAICKLEATMYDEVSLDHDLGQNSFYGNKEMTGRDILNWLIARRHHGFFTPRIVLCHSANPVARNTMCPDCERYFGG